MKSLIFIPDIGGFTNFVKSIDIDLGVSITGELLNEIIDSNPLDIQLSEIEGDAVLFYKVGNPLPLKQIFAGLQSIYEAFNKKFTLLKSRYNIQADLSLKFIVHYGDIGVYDIKGFRKLYGQTVIESHSLLKNDYGVTDYILITDDYFYALNQSASDVRSAHWKYTSYSSRVYSGLRKIGYSFYTYFPVKTYQHEYAYAHETMG